MLYIHHRTFKIIALELLQGETMFTLNAKGVEGGSTGEGSENVNHLWPGMDRGWNSFNDRI